MADPVLSEQLNHTLAETHLDSLGERYRGKVRDVYRQRDRLFLVATDRLSAFDRVLTTIPFKGEVLNRIARFWFEKTQDVVPNHVLDTPDPNVTVARATKPFPVEVVVRGYLTGSLWRDFQKGAHTAYGLDLPPDMRKDAAFPEPILTPSTKAPVGEHDEPLSEAEVVRRGIASERDWARIREAALAPVPRRTGVVPRSRAAAGGHQVRVRRGGRLALRHRRDAHPGQLAVLAREQLRGAARLGRGPGHAGQGERPAVADSREGLQRARTAPGHPRGRAGEDGRAVPAGVRGDHRHGAEAGPRATSRSASRRTYRCTATCEHFCIAADTGSFVRGDG